MSSQDDDIESQNEDESQNGDIESQDDDSESQDDDDIECKYCGEKCIFDNWCNPCQINNLKQNFTNWTSGNEKVDELIQEIQMKINNYDDIIVEWIPHNQFNNIKEISKDDSVTLYSALWPNNKNVTLKCIHNSQNITDEFLNEVKSYPIVNYENNKIYGISQDPDTKDYIIVVQSNYCEICGEIYTNIYVEWCKSCQINNLKQNFVNWSSENKKIDESIQSMQMNIKSCQDLIVEWVPYNQFDDIKEINKDDSATLYSALWMNGPLEYEYDKKEYERVPNKKVALKCLHNSQENINEFLKEVKSYIIDISKDEMICGISRNPNTSDYIIVLRDDYCESCGVIYSKIDCKWCKPCQINNLKQNFTNRTSENEKIDELIQEMQMKINKPRDVIVEWIQYDQFNDIKEINKNDSAIIFTAIWIDGPLEYSYEKEHYERTSNYHEVILKCLLSSRNITNEFLNEVKSYTITINKYENNILLIYGISQNPDTKDYIIVLQNSYCKSCGNVCVYNWCQSCQINNLKQNFTNWTSGNEKVDELIQEMQMKIKTSNDLIVEWILYNQFSDIKEISKNDSTILYSAIWKDGSLNYDYEKEYERTPNYAVTLKYLLGSHDVTNEFLNEVKSYFIKADEKDVPKVYGISQNPDTKDYIIVFSDDFCGNCGEIYANMRERWCKLCHKNYLKQNFANCTSGNEKIDNFIQEMQSKISNYDDVIVEWIPFNQFNNIKEIGKGGFAVIYSAIWKDGPLEYDTYNVKWKRTPNKEVALKNLFNSQNISNEFLNEVKKYSINNDENIIQIFGISQNPDTKDYIMVLQYAKGGDFNSYIDKYIVNWVWRERLFALGEIIKGLKKIHGNNMVHRDFHTGNILSSFDEYYIETKNPIGSIYISDMGLCGEVNNVDKTKIFGVMPFVAPEVLKQKPYTQAADIYSFGMIMYFVATRRQPFANCAHDSILMINICNGIRPEINEQEAPKCYIDLMKRCWDSNPDNRPSAIEIEELIKLFSSDENEEIINQFEKAEKYRIENSLSIENDQLTTHPHAYNISRCLNDIPNYDNISVEVFDFTE